MIFRRRLLIIFGFGLGLIGSIVCVVVIRALWSIDAQLHHSTETVFFANTDDLLVFVRERAERARNRVTESAITTESMSNSLKEWTTREASQRRALRLNVAENSDKVHVALQQVDDWLEASASSVELVQHTLSMGNVMGVQLDTGFVDALVEETASLRNQLAEAIEFVKKVHERMTAMGEEEPAQDRIEQAVQLALRVVATLSSIDSRLEKLESRLLVAQRHLQSLEIGTLKWIRVATITFTLLMIWMGAGQVALCWSAWTARVHPK